MPCCSVLCDIMHTLSLPPLPLSFCLYPLLSLCQIIFHALLLQSVFIDMFVWLFVFMQAVAPMFLMLKSRTSHKNVRKHIAGVLLCSVCFPTWTHALSARCHRCAKSGDASVDILRFGNMYISNMNASLHRWVLSSVVFGKLVFFHPHLFFNCRGCLGTTDDFRTGFLLFSLFFSASWDLANSLAGLCCAHRNW